MSGLPSPRSGPAAQTAEELNLKQVAALLGVHYMTAYRYVRQGRLDATRAGTEWRVARVALERFLSPNTSTGGHEDEVPHRASRSDQLKRCLLIGDESSAWRTIENALAAGRDPTFCYLEMIAAALAAISDESRRGELDAADQLLSSAVATRLVARLGARFRRPGRSRGTVVLGAPVGEVERVPITIVSDLVRLRGYDVLELGTDVPAAAFVSIAQRASRLVAVGIGVTRPELLDAAQEIVDSIRHVDESIPIVVGGLAAAATPAAADLRGVTATATSGREADTIVDSAAKPR